MAELPDAAVDATDATRRSEFLAEASALLAETLDYNDTLRRIAALAVPRVADWCVVSVLQPDGELRRVAVVHRDPAKAPLCDAYLRQFPPNAHRKIAPLEGLRQGQALLLPEVHEAALAEAAQSEEHLAVIRGLGARSMMIVPMRSPRQLLGVISFVISGGERRYTAADLALAEDLAGRAGSAVENALLYAEAQQARAGLELALGVRDEFLTVASHELRTPLSALQLSVQGLRRLRRGQGGPVSWERLDGRLEIIEKQVGRLTRLVGRLLDVSRSAPDHLPLELELEEVDLAEVLRDAVARAGDEAAQAGCALTVVAPARCTGRWDRLRLDQVVGNLLSNAFKFGPGAPVALTLRCGEDEAELTVRDQGIGVAPGDQARIFERFERASPASQYGGLGLGLWICKQIATALGGDVSVESVPGCGATFTLRLPRRPAEGSQGAP